MGPEATCDLFLKIIKSTPARKDQDHIRVIIDSNPEIPDRTAYILGKGTDPRPYLIATAKNVEKAGASFIAIPCNTAHYFYDDIRSAVSIPVLHIMKEVARSVKGKVKKAGLLASTGTVKTGLYERALNEVGIEMIVPEGRDQDKVMEAIYLVKAGKLEEAKAIVLEQGKLLVSQGVEVVIAGCTEIPLILRDGDLPVAVIDATKILAEACVREALAG
ncbi:MAG: amino acid racemase [Candidatus Fermentithermobacillus carboniphilus]|uniref:Amino acid racemase n=1 Tax=Candidatus Fermentithermobacillus carboniphilus TaxID=3085328 RepID=A0AAT9LIT2_9FIRM|nr:MAG: amino acid racemase [Candidatus Fermentithermobacillus carboniphilus]